jgi:hypothetical protein
MGKEQYSAEERPDGAEKRLVFRVLRAWREAKGERPFPSPADIGPETLGADGRHCVVLKLNGEAAPPTFRHVGQEFDAASLAGRPLGEADDKTLLGNGLTYWQRTLARKVPISIGDEFTDSDGRRVLFRSIILPLSEGGTEIDHLLAAANCKIP